jgi:signal peptidase I
MPRRRLGRLTARLPDPARVVLDWVVTLVSAVAVVLLVKAFVINPYRIPSSSMEPTLHCAQPVSGCLAGTSDRVLANRFVFHLRDPRRGELVVFDTPPAAESRCGAGGTFVKRVIGLPGERIAERDGVVYVDGRRLEEPYLQAGRRDGRNGAWSVGPGQYFMMGDNRAGSCDSRVWGAVPRSNLIGTVFATYWPPARLSLR